MPYIDLAGLSRYASRQKERLERDYALLRDMQWTRSEKAGAVSLWPVGGTPLKPGVDFLFTETPPAEGDKSPSNPSTITGVSSVKVTRTGKNLLYYPYNRLTRTSNGVTFTANEDGTVTINGTCAGGSYFSVCDAGLGSSDTSTKIRLVRGLPYIGSLNIVSGSYSGSLWFSGSNGADGGNPFATAITPQNPSALIDWTGTGAAENLRFFLAAGSGAVFNSLRVAPQLELGSTATSFEPYSGTDYTVNLGGTYYGGTLDVATGVMTVTHVSMIFNDNTYFSSSIFEEYTSAYRLGVYPFPSRRRSQPASEDVASNTIPVTVGATPQDVSSFNFSNNSFSINVVLTKADAGLSGGASYSDVAAAFNSFFSAHPTTIVYPVAEPFTIQLTPTEILSLFQSDKYTPRLNTVYTDAQAVQVGYIKSPIRDEYELTQAIAAQGGNV